MYWKLILFVCVFKFSSSQVIQHCPNIFLSETVRPSPQMISTPGVHLSTPQIQQCPNAFILETNRPPAQIISTAGLQLPIPQIPPGNVIVQDNTSNVCKDLAKAVETMVLNRLLDSSRRKPVFNQIAGSLLNDLVVRTTGCPVCKGQGQVSNQILISTGSQPCGFVAV